MLNDENKKSRRFLKKKSIFIHQPNFNKCKYMKYEMIMLNKY